MRYNFDALMENDEKGFTLIELLVVISIIGLLTSVVLAGLQNARLKARDIQRLSDLRQIQNALQLYYVDHNGTYPGSANTLSNDWGQPFKDALTPTYISKLPIDPINDGLNANVALRYYYTFFNPQGVLWGKCATSSVVLSNVGEVNSKLYIDQCEINWNRKMTIVLQE